MSDTNRVRLAFAKESTYGAQVVAGRLQRLRLTGESLKQDSTIVPSEEIRDDRQVANIVRTSIGASGAVNFELSHETYDDLIAAALQSVNVRAQGTLTMDTNPTDGDTITIGSVTYTFKDTMASANDVKIGAAVANTQASLVATINGEGVAGTDYYAGTTTPHPQVRAADFDVSDDCVITAKKAGVDGNSIATTETFTAGTNVFDAATLGTTTAGAGWSATVTVTASTISAVAATDSIDDSGAGFGSIADNDWVYVTGFTNAANNGWFKVATASAGSLVMANGSAIVDEASGSSRTVKKLPSIVNGVQQDTFNLEKTYADLSNVLNLYTGMGLDNLNLDVPVDGIITGSFDFMGTKEDSLASSVAEGYWSAPTTIPMATVNDFDNLFENNADQAMINCTLTIANSLRARLEAGTLGPSSLGSGDCGITGTLQAYFVSHTLMDKFLDHTESALAICLKDEAGNGYVFDFPAIRYTNGQRVAGGKNDDVIADMEWSAFMHATEGITVRVARLDA